MTLDRPLTRDLLAPAADLLTDAFFSNPAHVCIRPDELTRARRLRWLMGFNVRAQARVGEGFCIASGGRLDAMGFWHAPNTREPGLLALVQDGLLAAPFRLGWSGVERMLEVSGRVEELRRAALGVRGAWYLHNMVVREELRGTGIGSALLRAQLDDVLGREPRHAAVLATQRPENVVFYRRLGFEVASEVQIGAGPQRFVNWMMVHAAR